MYVTGVLITTGERHVTFYRSSSFFSNSPPTEIYTLSLHDALPICRVAPDDVFAFRCVSFFHAAGAAAQSAPAGTRDGKNETQDRKSTRLNSSHVRISYAVFCLKKKKQTIKSPNGSIRFSWLPPLRW